MSTKKIFLHLFFCQTEKHKRTPLSGFSRLQTTFTPNAILIALLTHHETHIQTQCKPNKLPVNSLSLSLHITAGLW